MVICGQDLIAMTQQQNRKSLSYAIAAVYNCVSAEMPSQLRQLASCKPLLSQLLLNASPAPATASHLEAPSNSDDPASEWIHLLCCRLLHAGLFGVSYATVASR